MDKKLMVFLIVIFSVYYSPLTLADKGKEKAKDKGESCYVSGNPDYNEHEHGHPNKHQLGSNKNPYSSLAEVEADEVCNHIHVLYSDTVLDGGITLRDGQKLTGKKGKHGNHGKLPMITNSTFERTFGGAILLGRNNEVKYLHIKDTQNSSILGNFQVQPFGGKLKIENVLITGANQAGLFDPGLGGLIPNSSVLLASVEDVNITIKKSDIGQSNVPSILIFTLSGQGHIEIKDTIVHDQAQLSENFEISPGILISAVGNSSIDAVIKKTRVDNIGSEFISNSDGLLLLNTGSGTMNAEVDAFHYSNPDNGGINSGRSTGIEIGFNESSGGGIFNAVIKNSIIEDAPIAGIQILDQLSYGSNTLNVTLDNNNFSGSDDGIQVLASNTPYSNISVNILNNTVTNSADNGFVASMWDGPLDSVNILLEGNTFENSSVYGMYFWLQQSASVNNFEIDAGLGALGSTGMNRIINSGIDINADGQHISAGNNWWGSNTGPAAVGEENGGSVDYTPFLLADPKQ